MVWPCITWLSLVELLALKHLWYVLKGDTTCILRTAMTPMCQYVQSTFWPRVYDALLKKVEKMIHRKIQSRIVQIGPSTAATCQKSPQSCSFLFQPFRSFTRCNPITFSNKWNAFIPSRGNNLGSHIGSIGSLLRSPLPSPPAAPLCSAIHSSQPLSSCLPDLSPSCCLLWQGHLKPGVLSNAPVLKKK